MLFLGLLAVWMPGMGQNHAPFPVWQSSDTHQLPRISVKGNRFVDPNGHPVILRGISIIDLPRIVEQGHWNKEHFAQVRAMGAAVVRIPVHPSAWRAQTPAGYLKLLDQAVTWCTELGMYVIVDWHSIGNLCTEQFEHPMYNTTRTETFEFWRIIAGHFQGKTTTVAFYEIFNEPTTFFNRLGPVTWEEWKKLNEQIIATIRAADHETIPLVAGFDWAYDLTPLRLTPLAVEGIGYVTHPYEHKRPKPWEPRWDEDFGFAAEQFPLFATEFGFGGGRNNRMQDDEYGTAITTYLESKGISWAAWAFDTDWQPALLQSIAPYTFTHSGEFFRNVLRSKMVQEDSLRVKP